MSRNAADGEGKNNLISLQDIWSNTFQLAFFSARPVMILNDQGCVAYWNAAAEALYGWDLEGHRNKTPPMIPIEGLTLFARKLSESFAQKTVISYESTHIRADKTHIKVQVWIHPAKSDQGWEYCLVWISDVSERNRLSVELAVSEARFNTLSDALPQMVWTALPDGRVDYVNSRWLRYTGLQESDILGRGFSCLIHPDDLAASKVEYRRAKNSGLPLETEHRFRRYDGVYRWFLIRALPFRASNTEPISKWFGTCTDIEDQRQSKKDLEVEIQKRIKDIKNSETFLDSVIENIPNMVFVKEAEALRFVRFNRAAELLTGIQSEEIIGKSDYDFFPAAQADFFQKKDQEVLSGKKMIDIAEEPLKTRSNQERILYTRKIPILDDNGEPKYLLGISEDITERRAVEKQKLKLIEEQAARAAAEKLTERLSLLSDASGLLSASMNQALILKNLCQLTTIKFFEWCSIETLEMPGILKVQAIGYRHDFLAQSSAYVQGTLIKDPTYISFQVIHSGKSRVIERLQTDKVSESEKGVLLQVLQQMKFNSVICVPLRARNQILGVMTLGCQKREVNAEDLDLVEEVAVRAGLALENIKLYLESQNINRIKDEFLATLSHELRTPLNVILGHAQLLLENKDEKETKENKSLLLEESIQSVQTIFRNASLQTQIINDLLDVSAVITGKTTYKPVLVNPLEVIKNATESARSTADAKGVDIICSLPEKQIEILADPTRLQQIMWNLLSNAIKYTPSGGRISIVAFEVNKEFVFKVKDTGVGMDQEFLPYVFDRFRQEDSSMSRRFGGLGLGLAIVRHLVELHGGNVKAESDGKGQGSCFTVRIPLRAKVEVAEPQRAVAVPRAKVKSERIDGVKVLLVEDSEDNRMLLRMLLNKNGAEVQEAESAESARFILREFKPDLIISDIGMPREDGLTFIQKWRRFERSVGEASIPAIALTAYVRAAEIKVALQAGFQAHVAKPVSLPNLLSVIHRLTKDSQRVHENHI